MVAPMPGAQIDTWMNNGNAAENVLILLHNTIFLLIPVCYLYLWIKITKYNVCILNRIL